MQILAVVVAMSVAAKLVGLGALLQRSAVAAAEAPRPPAAAEPEGGPCEEAARGFRDLLTTVHAQADDLARREADLKAREASLGALKRAAGAEVARLEGVAKALGITGGPGTGLAIAKVYESMRAEDAAPILDRLDDATLRMLLGRIRERQVGALLAAMNRDRAVAVTKALAGPTLAAVPPSPPPADKPAAESTSH
jgi:flagellar motility protein MotE (MotC chaperone)